MERAASHSANSHDKIAIAKTITTVIQMASATGLLGFGRSSNTRKNTRILHLRLKRQGRVGPPHPFRGEVCGAAGRSLRNLV